jgi:hypothetical protein
MDEDLEEFLDRCLLLDLEAGPGIAHFFARIQNSQVGKLAVTNGLRYPGRLPATFRQGV